MFDHPIVMELELAYRRREEQAELESYRLAREAGRAKPEPVRRDEPEPASAAVGEGAQPQPATTAGGGGRRRAAIEAALLMSWDEWAMEYWLY